MFGNREVHRKLSGTGGYAAGRLAEISESLGQLAKVMKNSGEDPGLSREDGIAALEFFITFASCPNDSDISASRPAA